MFVAISICFYLRLKISHDKSIYSGTVKTLPKIFRAKSVKVDSITFIENNGRSIPISKAKVSSGNTVLEPQYKC